MISTTDTVEQVAYALRLPRQLKADLERLAKDNHRSLNSEIVWRLIRSLREE